jgi:hypothetical protein
MVDCNKAFVRWWEDKGSSLYDIPESIARELFGAGFEENMTGIIDSIVECGGVNDEYHKEWLSDKSIQIFNQGECDEIVVIKSIGE